jgi:tetratricopeptide (TPR) repeat protein
MKARRQSLGIAAAGIVLMTALAAGLISCGKPADPAALFGHAEYLVLEQQWDEAKTVLRQVLVAEPRHAGAHYYLGRCYFASQEQFWFAIAEGEIRTALRLFKEDGGASPIERFSDTYFELICHLDLVKITLRQILFLMDSGMPGEGVLKLVELAEADVEAARAIDPESPDLPGFVEILGQLRATLEAEPAARPAVPRPDPPPSRRGVV